MFEHTSPHRIFGGPLHLSPNLGLVDSKTDVQRRCISPSRSSRQQKKVMPDRFIPNRVRPGSSSLETQLGQDTKSLAAAYGVRTSRVLEYQRPTPQLTNNPLNLCRPYADQPSQAASYRNLCQIPERVLDAPGIRDDFYINVLSWSRKNQLAIALDNSVYLYDANTLSATHLHGFEDGGYVSCVQHNRGHHLSVATSDGTIAIFDVATGKKLRSMRKHLAAGPDRCLALAWNGSVLSSGSDSGKIWHHDVRVADHNTTLLDAHTDSVCALAYRREGSTLASSSRDQTVKMWDARSSAPRLSLTAHDSAVKAMDWCPQQSTLLATGGGSNDRHIKIWNTTTGACLNSVDTGSQVSSLHWAPDAKELVSCHGLPFANTVVWSANLQRVASIQDNGGRIFDACLGPDGQTLVTAADENLKFWKVFQGQQPQRPETTTAKLTGGVILR